MNFDKFDNLNPEDIIAQYNDIVEFGNNAYDTFLAYGCWWQDCDFCRFGCTNTCNFGDGEHGAGRISGYSDACWNLGADVCRSIGSEISWTSIAYFGLPRGYYDTNISWTRRC